MISRMLGAPLGGTMRGAHHGVDVSASSLITPPKGVVGAGSCVPSMVVVAPGLPSSPVTCWAIAVPTRADAVTSMTTINRRMDMTTSRVKQRFNFTTINRLVFAF